MEDTGPRRRGSDGEVPGGWLEEVLVRTGCSAGALKVAFPSSPPPSLFFPPATSIHPATKPPSLSMSAMVKSSQTRETVIPLFLMSLLGAGKGRFHFILPQYGGEPSSDLGEGVTQSLAFPNQFSHA